METEVVELAPAEPSTARQHRRKSREERRVGAARAFAAASFGYLCVSLVIWWHVWSGHPASTVTCGCGDPALFLWMLEWPAYALTHGHSLFYSSSMFHPKGIDLLSNTSVLAIGVPLVPVTLLFGPVATLNVALLLSPVSSAVAMFWLMRRWTRWQPAAFCGGLLFGFSPFVVNELSVAHLHISTLAVLPLFLGWAHDLLFRKRHPSLVSGAVLGLLLVVQFFISTEILLILLAGTAFSLIVVALRLALSDPVALRRSTSGLLPAIAVVCVVPAVLLAYPVWVALEGRAHLSGLVWPNPLVGGFGVDSFVNPGISHPANLFLFLAGYSGNFLPSQAFVGWGMLAVVVIGFLAWRRDTVLQFFFVLGLASFWMATDWPVKWLEPWRLLSGVPLFDNVITMRFAILTLLALSAMLAIVVDHVRALDPIRRRRPGTGSRTSVPRSSGLGLGLATLVLLVALGPVAAALAPDLPLATQNVALPAWYSTVGKRAATGQVLLTYPAAFSDVTSSMAWQAVDAMAWFQVGGGGPGSVLSRAGRERAAQVVLSDLSLSLGPLPDGDRSQLDTVRSAIRAWGVTEVVVPAEAASDYLLEGRSRSYAVAFTTAVLGVAPTNEHGAWVWRGVAHDVGPRSARMAAPPPGTLSRCSSAYGSTRSVGASVARCVIDATSR